MESKFTFYFCCIASLLFSFGKRSPVFAQSSTLPCATDRFSQAFLDQHPITVEYKEELETFTQNWIKENQTNLSLREPIVIPVVVHIIWNEMLENITEEQIHSQIDVLNKDFRQLNADLSDIPTEFTHLAADIEIEFCLASIDPEGNPTEGITRQFTTFKNIAFAFGDQNRRRIKHDDLGGTDAWDTNEYLNIWVGASDFSLAGDATYPGAALNGEDGIVVEYNFFGTKGVASTNIPYHLGRTATHEVGHFFNLQHLWGERGCPDDDGVWDTPYQASPNFQNISCPSHPNVSCGTADMFMNFMNYVPDDCMHLFTIGQKWRMLAALNGPRSGLLTSNGCGNGSNPIPSILANQYTLYPNPTSNILNVYIPNTNQLEFLDLYSMDGKAIQGPPYLINGKLHQLDLTNIPSGIYVLHIRLKGEDIYEKLMISK